MIGSETEARDWVASTFDVPRETMARLDAFAELLRSENERQNLIAHSTVDHIWARHIADSAQLLRFAPLSSSSWLDLGTGAGFPGLIVAALHDGPVTLVESRKLRVDFLRSAAEILGVTPEILHTRLERAPIRSYNVISARAFAGAGRLLPLSHPFSTEKTRWVLPKGRSAQSELEQLESTWQGDFRLEPSLTDPEARIIVADRVRPKRQRKP
ncbi:MAG TPA: 16S rRNA (guanine(527)-N(7))-methyltransferase RsmG [Allosphingosinicella sp.]